MSRIESFHFVWALQVERGGDVKRLDFEGIAPLFFGDDYLFLLSAIGLGRRR